MKEKILALRTQGKTYNQIAALTGASKGTIAFHCSRDVKKEYYLRRQRNKKLAMAKLRQAAGGKCARCPYDKCASALEFHHPSDDKEGCVATILAAHGFKAALKEAKKCILLCANCHREEHDSLNK